MSALDEKQVTLSNASRSPSGGGGDGSRNDPSQEKEKLRTPVPSCRRFYTRPPHQDSTNKNRVRVQLQRAINDLATNPKITRRKALTMAEINPTRNHMYKNSNIESTCTTPISTMSSRATIRKDEVARLKHRREREARRRVCYLLLLNAWRRRREQVSALIESLEAERCQNGQLELQVDALRQLRQSECEKRNQAMIETQQLSNSLSVTLLEKQELFKKCEDLRREMKVKDEKTDQLKLEVKNALETWNAARGEIFNLEQTLEGEKEKIKKMRQEKISLTEQLTQKEFQLTKLNHKIDSLEDKLFQSQGDAKEMMQHNEQKDETVQELLKEVESKVVVNLKLDTECNQLRQAKSKLENQLSELKLYNQSMLSSQDLLKHENQDLKEMLKTLKLNLKKEQNRSLLRSLGVVATFPLNIFLEIAAIMLPALPESRNLNINPVGSTIQKLPDSSLRVAETFTHFLAASPYSDQIFD